jgi:hypothetical protein
LRDASFYASVNVRSGVTLLPLSAAAPLCGNRSLAAIRQFSRMLGHAAATSLVILNDGRAKFLGVI